MKKFVSHGFSAMEEPFRHSVRYALSLVSIFALGVCLLTSCTVDEPSDMSGGSPDNYLISRLTSYGITIMAFEYDNLNRPIEIKMGEGVQYAFTYSDNTAVPRSIEAKFYDDNDGDWRIDEQTLWTNIKLNSHGFIESYDIEETDYDTYSGEPAKEYGHALLTYDSDGHLTRLSTDYEATDRDEAYTDVTYYEWNNGLLMSWGELPGEDHREWWTAEYSDTANPLLQWDPNNEFMGPLASTDLFGVAPVKFISKSINHYGESQEEVQFSYALNENNLIRACRILDEELLTYNFSYIKKK